MSQASILKDKLCCLQNQKRLTNCGSFLVIEGSRYNYLFFILEGMWQHATDHETPKNITDGSDAWIFIDYISLLHVLPGNLECLSIAKSLINLCNGYNEPTYVLWNVQMIQILLTILWQRTEEWIWRNHEFKQLSIPGKCEFLLIYFLRYWKRINQINSTYLWSSETLTTKPCEFNIKLLTTRDEAHYQADRLAFTLHFKLMIK